jgi:hypothetical protein
MRSRGPAALAASGEIAAPAIFAESCANVVLPPQPDQQAERLFYRLLLCLPRGLLGFSHESIIDFDRRPHQ